MNHRKILADNVRALMDRNPTMKSARLLSKHCSTHTKKVSARAIGYLVKADSGISPTFDTIVAIAQAFKVRPCALISPNFDPDTKDTKPMPAPETLELARRITSLNPDKRELLLQIFGEAVSDDEVEANGFSVEAAEGQALHQTRKNYKINPRQMKMALKRR